jgi:Zn-dependent protease with chaperone function
MALLLALLGISFVTVARAFQASGNPSGNTNTQAHPEVRNGQPESTKTNTQEFHLSRERYEQAVRYSRAGYLLYFASVAWEILVLVILLNTGLVAKWRDCAGKTARHWVVQGIIFVPGLFVVMSVAQLPIRIYWHSLSLRYQQSIQRWPSWMGDWAKGELIRLVFGLVAVVILFAVIRKSPQRWWLYFWFVSIPLLLFTVLITPLVLDPMFHKFAPLEQTNPTLVASIEKLTQRAGDPIPRNRMFLMVASQKTNQINAYVTGIGASKRVVVWDNTIKKMAPDEVLFIVGHEMGHYVLGHVVKGIAFALVGILAALWVAYRALECILRRWGAKWGVRGQEDWAALAVLWLIGSMVGFIAEPIGNGFSRMVEHAADVYGLEVIHGIVPNAQETAAHSFQVMGELDLADPEPPRIIAVWLYSHPPLADRLKFAHDYDPWREGKSPRYVK